MCNSPITVKPKYFDSKVHLMGRNHSHRTFSVPCGVCSVCKENRIREWTFRLKKEQERSRSVDFITLTYDTEHMDFVYVPYFKGRYGTLNPDHLKNFWKKLRMIEDRKLKKLGEHKSIKELKKHPDYKPIRYYACGEYGKESTMRPHYHAIVFNVVDKLSFFEAWKKGIVDVSDKPVGPGAMAYCAKYIDKPKKLHSNDPRIKEFSRMSKRLGENYITPEIIEYHKAKPEQRNYVTYLDGVKSRMPVYYRKKIFSNVERYKQAIHNEELAEEQRNKLQLEAEEQGKIFEDLEMERKKYHGEKFDHLNSKNRNSCPEK